MGYLKRKLGGAGLCLRSKLHMTLPHDGAPKSGRMNSFMTSARMPPRMPHRYDQGLPKLEPSPQSGPWMLEVRGSDQCSGPRSRIIHDGYNCYSDTHYTSILGLALDLPIQSSQHTIIQILTSTPSVPCFDPKGTPNPSKGTLTPVKAPRHSDRSLF